MFPQKGINDCKVACWTSGDEASLLSWPSTKQKAPESTLNWEEVMDRFLKVTSRTIISCTLVSQRTRAAFIILVTSDRLILWTYSGHPLTVTMATVHQSADDETDHHVFWEPILTRSLFYLCSFYNCAFCFVRQNIDSLINAVIQLYKCIDA